MPDLNLILQVEQGDADVRLPRQVNLSLHYISGVPTAPRSRRVDRDEDRIEAPSIAGIRSVVRASRPAAVLAAAKTPEVWLVDRLAAPQPRNLDA